MRALCLLPITKLPPKACLDMGADRDFCAVIGRCVELTGSGNDSGWVAVNASNISVLQGRQCRDTVTSYFRGVERLRKLGNSAQSEALTHITWTWTGSDYQLHDSIALLQDFA